MIRTQHRLDCAVHRRQRCRGGFTLLELLVVVSLIALLITVLLPGLRIARDQAKRTSCSGNVRQLLVAWESYFQDSQGRLLQKLNAHINYGGIQGSGSKPVFEGEKPLNGHLRLPLITFDGEVFHCPADRGNASAKVSCYVHYGNSYNANSMLIGNKSFPIPPSPGGVDWPKWRWDLIKEVNRRLPGLSLSRVSANASSLVLLGDFEWLRQLEHGPAIADWHRARDRFVIGFLDGHASFERIEPLRYVRPACQIVPFADLHAKVAVSQAGQ